MPNLAYTPKIGARICELVMDDESTMAKVAKGVGVTRASICNWALNKSLKMPDGSTFADAFERARQISWELMAEDTMAIADDSSGDLYKDEMGRDKVDHENIQRSKLRVDTRKFILSKRVPKTWGEKLDVTGIPGAQTNILLSPMEQIKRLREARDGSSSDRIGETGSGS